MSRIELRVDQYLEKWNDRVKNLIIQGDFLNLLLSEQSNVAWKSMIYGVPKGVMEFAMRSSTNTLATPDNLKRWKKINNDNCKMCYKPNTHPHKATLFHILNHCESFLGENERMKWRHDSVLNFMTLTLKENKPSHIQVYADLEDHKSAHSTNISDPCRFAGWAAMLHSVYCPQLFNFMVVMHKISEFGLSLI